MGTGAPRVSVIVPAYNAERYLRETLESLMRQEGVSFEVIVVDDGSTDETPVIIEEYRDRIVARRQENAGQAAAMNHALTLVRGEYVAYLDADDLCLPGRLASQARYLDEHPEAVGVYSPSQYIDHEGRPLQSRSATAPNAFGLLYVNYIPHSSVMHRRSCVERVGMFDTSYLNQDWDLWVRISEHGRWGCIIDPLIEYRVHPLNTSRTRGRPNNHYRQSRMIMLQKTALRRGNPWWLRAMCFRARAEWWLLSPPVLSELAPRWWWVAHRVWGAIEQRLVRVLAGDKVLPEPWRA